MLAIAAQVSRSTVYWEIKRNSHNGVHQSAKEHARACTRRVDARKYRVPVQTVIYVELALSWHSVLIMGTKTEREL